MCVSRPGEEESMRGNKNHLPNWQVTFLFLPAKPAFYSHLASWRVIPLHKIGKKLNPLHENKRYVDKT
jgi:hypothetical protein